MPIINRRIDALDVLAIIAFVLLVLVVWRAVRQIRPTLPDRSVPFVGGHHQMKRMMDEMNGRLP